MLRAAIPAARRPHTDEIDEDKVRFLPDEEVRGIKERLQVSRRAVAGEPRAT